jgi:hypothetical protein
MRKTINVKEPTELELKFEDGKSLILKFDMEALSNFYEMPEGLNGFIHEESMVERCAMIVYISGLAQDNELTMEKSRAIVANMDPASITDVVTEFMLSMGGSNNELIKELQKKTMQEFLQKLK